MNAGPAEPRPDAEQRVYLDHAATTCMDPRVAEAVAEAVRRWPGNPSSVHREGREARAALEQARTRLAAVLGCRPQQVVFTSSGSEANNLAIKGTVFAGARPAHLIAPAIEHDSVLRAARWLALRHADIELTELPVGADGAVDPDAIWRALRPETRLVCLMHANNETGRLQPVAAVAGFLSEAGVLLHCDAVQSPGRVPVDFARLGCDTLSISAHKLGGPRGVGALVVRDERLLEPLIHGGNQEQRLRAGTENVPGAIGLALAAELAVEALESNAAHLRALEEAFLDELNPLHPDLQINGARDDKLPGMINLAVRGVHQDDLVVGMDLAGFAISAGSACSSGVIEPSHVLTGMGLEAWRVQGAVRVTFGVANTIDQARSAARALIQLVQRLRKAMATEEIR